MLDENKFLQYGYPRTVEDIKGITLHETGNIEMNAQQLRDFLNDVNKTSAGYHYVVDKDEVVQLMPDDWAVWHTGKAKDWGDRYTIAVSICSYLNNDDFALAEQRTIELVEQLKEEYHIRNDMVFFHADWNERTYCPKTWLDQYGNSINFVYERIKEV